MLPISEINRHYTRQGQEIQVIIQPQKSNKVEVKKTTEDAKVTVKSNPHFRNHEKRRTSDAPIIVKPQVRRGGRE